MEVPHTTMCELQKQPGNKSGWAAASPLWSRRRATEMVPRGALPLGEPRAVLIRSEWAGAPQRSRENGGKVVRRGLKYVE